MLSLELSPIYESKPHVFVIAYETGKVNKTIEIELISQLFINRNAAEKWAKDNIKNYLNKRLYILRLLWTHNIAKIEHKVVEETVVTYL